VDNFYIQKVAYNPILERTSISLPTTIIGDYITSDLNVRIRPTVNMSFKNTRTIKRLIPLKLKDNKEEWRKYVELAFKNYAYNYYFFTGNQKAYKEVRDEHWIVEVEGYTLEKNIPGVDKSKQIKKFVFNLSRYKSVDEVIRDLINRVTILTNKDISCTINGIVPVHEDLNAIIVAKKLRKTTRQLKAFVKTVSNSSGSLYATISSINNKQTFDLSLSIESNSFEFTPGQNINFDISNSNLVDESNKADFNFDLGDI